MTRKSLCRCEGCKAGRRLNTYSRSLTRLAGNISAELNRLAVAGVNAWDTERGRELIAKGYETVGELKSLQRLAEIKVI